MNLERERKEIEGRRKKEEGRSLKKFNRVAFEVQIITR
jgi:hypothetical protein